MLELYTNNILNTQKVGEALGELANRGDIFLLEGTLGSGKTTLVKGIAKGLGIEESVSSPTFTLINQYIGRLPLYHFDLYRLGGEEELLKLGYEEYFYDIGLTVIEWAEYLDVCLPDEYLLIRIRASCDEEDGREITIIPKGSRYEGLAEELELYEYTWD